MKKIIIFLCILFFYTIQAYSQNTERNINFINEVADKEKATFSEGVHFFIMVMGESPGTFNKNIAFLNKEGITKGITQSENTPLRRGTFALMMARHLDCKDTLLFRIFETERYAYRACTANGIMSHEGSEWDILSGGELIEIMTKVSELSGGNE
ncbi:MAG: hypothetical protein JW864_00660 [Spirochaetes bacterium]|nr:hypothetical protein [Spirochaetota bacterium]